MQYKKINLKKAKLNNIEESLAKELIDWRASIKRPMTQRVFDTAIKQAIECQQYGATIEEALVRWRESGWTGMKWVLAEYERESKESKSTRSRSIKTDLNDRGWAE